MSDVVEDVVEDVAEDVVEDVVFCVESTEFPCVALVEPVAACVGSCCALPLTGISTVVDVYCVTVALIVEGMTISASDAPTSSFCTAISSDKGAILLTTDAVVTLLPPVYANAVTSTFVITISAAKNAAVACVTIIMYP